MRAGILISVLLHIATLFAFAGGIASTRPIDVPITKPLPVNIVTSGEFTKIKAGSQKVKPKKVEKKKAVPKPKAQQKVKKKKTKPKAVKQATVKKKKPAAKPKSVPKKAKPKKKIVKKVKPKNKPKPKKKVVQKKAKPKNAKKARKDFSPDKIAALLNKIPDAKKREAPRPKPKKTREKKSEKVAGYEQGEDVTMSINEIDAFISQISNCWETPIGGLGAERIVIKMRLLLKKNGELARQPEVINFSNSPFFRTAQESAIRAVLECQPYRLPRSKYVIWKEMVLNFDPRRMYGG